MPPNASKGTGTSFSAEQPIESKLTFLGSGEGFCFFNSVAVAAGAALGSGAASRVCIVDWDVHHGNGTQRLFLDEPRVLFISLHRAYDGKRWRYPAPNATNPHCGSIDETGSGAAAGRTVNIAWPAPRGGDADYVAAFELMAVGAI